MGELYDYSNMVFVNANSSITVYCNKHKKHFDQLARAHLVGTGCKECYRENTAKTPESFIKEARLVHGDRYDYSKVDYKAANIPIEIICSKHGVFTQKPSKHLNGQNCRKCVNESFTKHEKKKIVNTAGLETYKQIFIAKANNKYNNAYDYSGINYLGTDVSVDIVCPKHGVFSVTPGQHLRAESPGCVKCGRNSSSKRDAYITKARAVHGDKYDYSKMDLNDEQITIICPEHNIKFKQRKDQHLNYVGCPVCNKQNMSKTTEEFVKHARDKWGTLYNYDKTNYVNNKTPVTITCSKHGDFEKIPMEHLRRTGGCQTCKASPGEVLMYDILTKYGFSVKREHTMPGYLYRYDFLIQEPIPVLIEYDEKHHRHAGHSRDVSDVDKNALAELHKMPLIRVSDLDKYDLENVLISKIRKYIKYKRDGVFYANFKTFAEAYNLPGTAIPNDYKTYLL